MFLQIPEIAFLEGVFQLRSFTNSLGSTLKEKDNRMNAFAVVVVVMVNWKTSS